MPIKNLFKSDLKVINIGLAAFKDGLDDVRAPCVQVDWRPPVDVDPSLLQKVRAHADAIAAANEKATDIILRGMPQLVRLDIARNVIPGMKDNLILHAGPPIAQHPMPTALHSMLLFPIVRVIAPPYLRSVGRHDGV